MLLINRVKIEIMTDNGVYGCDYSFNKGLNFLASGENTCGKSSILAAIYYCLGFEEIIGGKGEKVLTSAFKTVIEDSKKTCNVLQSYAYLEINNGAETVTLFRTAKMENRDSRMITVYYGPMNEIGNPSTVSVDTYVHMPNSAEHDKGFHSFLEKFLHLQLPRVATSDNKQRKLYLQLIFSCMFIEQKHGWASLFSGMPVLGIKESKKRIIEFILNLDTIENDKLREQLKLNESFISQEWNQVYSSLQIAARHESCNVINFPMNPKVLSDVDIGRIFVQQAGKGISEILDALSEEISATKQLKPKVADNFDDLQQELKTTEQEIARIENYVAACRKQLSIEKGSIREIKNNLESIAIDLSNNKDAARLRKLGSDLNFEFANDRCPVCHQHINDSLLPDSIISSVMGIDDNIRHLEAQQDMLQFALDGHGRHRVELEQSIQHWDSRLFTLRRLAQTIRNDLYSVSDDYSEAVVYKKITLTKRIEALNELQRLLNTSNQQLMDLSRQWEKYLEQKRTLPNDRLTNSDKDKLESLRRQFIKNLKSYGYKSIQNLNEITISEESYLPLFEGFDMKFDSSASDGIRLIWAFTMALLQVSLQKEGNHPGVLIFDEPDQQSIIIEDMKSFFDSILLLGNNCQAIIAITLNDSDTKNAINKLPEGTYLQHNIEKKAFAFLRENTPE